MFTTVSTQSRPVPAAFPARLAARLAIAPASPAPKRRKNALLRLDLDRRRREALSREFATRVTEHARWLPESDLALLNWVYRTGRPLTELAATGIAPRWVLHRRLNRIVARVLAPAYRHVALRLATLAEAPAWPPSRPPESEELFQLAAARAIFVNGLTVREVARVLGASRQRITRIREIVVLQAEALATNRDP